METNIKIKGWYEITIKDVNGKIKDTWTVDNLITNAGLAQLALLSGDASATPFTYLALGTGTTAAAASQTALVTEIVDSGLARAVGTVSRITTTVANDTLQIVYTWTPSGTKTIEEVGVFNAASVGTMLSRAVTGANAVVSGDQYIITYKLKFS